jgi:hypothetical protein
MFTLTFFIVLCTEHSLEVVPCISETPCVGGGWPVVTVKKMKHEGKGIKEERWLRGPEEGIF